MHKNATKCNETLSKWCKNKHGALKIMDTFEMYQRATRRNAPWTVHGSARKSRGLAIGYRKNTEGDKEPRRRALRSSSCTWSGFWHSHHRREIPARREESPPTRTPQPMWVGEPGQHGCQCGEQKPLCPRHSEHVRRARGIDYTTHCPGARSRAKRRCSSTACPPPPPLWWSYTAASSHRAVSNGDRVMHKYFLFPGRNKNLLTYMLISTITSIILYSYYSYTPTYSKTSNGTRAPCSPSFKKIENHTFKFQKIQDNKSWCRQLWDLLVCTKSIRNSLYFRLGKKDKCIDLDLVNSAYFESLKFWLICHFCWAQNTII
jgi:hypothetical protein